MGSGAVREPAGDNSDTWWLLGAGPGLRQLDLHLPHARTHTHTLHHTHGIARTRHRTHCITRSLYQTHCIAHTHAPSHVRGSMGTPISQVRKLSHGGSQKRPRWQGLDVQHLAEQDGAREAGVPQACDVGASAWSGARTPPLACLGEGGWC